MSTVLKPADWWALRDMIEQELASIGEPEDAYTRGLTAGLRGALGYMSGFERARAELAEDLVQAVEQ